MWAKTDPSPSSRVNLDNTWQLSMQGGAPGGAAYVTAMSTAGTVRNIAVMADFAAAEAYIENLLLNGS